MKNKIKRIKKGKFSFAFLVVVSIFAISMLFYSINSLFSTKDVHNEMINSMKSESRMSLTSFDKDLARKLMDKDNDGKCDSCGMPVEMCIDSGELQCTMGSKSGIGKLDSTHIHADLKIYINGKILDLSDMAHMDRMRANLPVSSFIHVDSGNQLPEKTGDVLHMHAKGVPLWIFFESTGMNFSKNCFILDSGEEYCNDDKNKLKFYVNSEENNEYENYVFKDLNKILISYGDETEGEIEQQLESITDYAKNH